MMTAAKEFNCPKCQFRLTIGNEDDDLMKYVQLHMDERHPDMGMTSKDAGRYIRKVQFEQPVDRRILERRPLERS